MSSLPAGFQLRSKDNNELSTPARAAPPNRSHICPSSPRALSSVQQRASNTITRMARDLGPALKGSFPGPSCVRVAGPALVQMRATLAPPPGACGAWELPYCYTKRQALEKRPFDEQGLNQIHRNRAVSSISNGTLVLGTGNISQASWISSRVINVASACCRGAVAQMAIRSYARLRTTSIVMSLRSTCRVCARQQDKNPPRSRKKCVTAQHGSDGYDMRRTSNIVHCQTLDTRNVIKSLIRGAGKGRDVAHDTPRPRPGRRGYRPGMLALYGRRRGVCTKGAKGKQLCRGRAEDGGDKINATLRYVPGEGSRGMGMEMTGTSMMRGGRAKRCKADEYPKCSVQRQGGE
ncbi:hypothetical protein C8Q78DRAFT_94696 [Trametes maxima]|nr:hypothetical protein C8Q78DRAFT_94696 [Trametes maxima]